MVKEMKGNGINKLIRKGGRGERLKLLQEVANVCGSRKGIQVIISNFKPTNPPKFLGRDGKGRGEDCLH
jgi:hypothetical protein